MFFDRSEFNDTLHITFTVDGNYEAPTMPTKASKSTFKILSTVLNIVKKQLPEYMAKARPPALSFTAKEDNRAGLYRKYFVPVIQNILGDKWQLEEYPNMGMTVFNWRPAKKQAVAESESTKAGIVQTEVYGTKAYHAKCMQPGCDWQSKRYDRIQQAQVAAQKHAEKHVGKKDVAEGKDFDTCFDKACKLYDKAENKNLEPTLVQVADFKGDGSGADPRWNKLPQHVWQHYVVIVGDQVLDPTARQFGADMPTRYPVSDLDRLWGKQYQIRPIEHIAESLTKGRNLSAATRKYIRDHEWKLITVDPQSLDLDSFDDPFNRVIDIDTDHPTNLQDPIIVHANGTTIIDGFHRAYQAQTQGLDKIPAWVPVQPGMAEGKITLSTDPNWYGATVDDYKATGPVVDIPADKLVGFEPDDKMNQPKSKANVKKIVAGLKRGHKLPPLLVRKYKNGYQVLDGHHRFWAYKLLGVQLIPAQIVPARDIEEKGKQGVAESLDQPYPLTWEQSEHGDWDATTQLPDGTPLTICGKGCP